MDFGTAWHLTLAAPSKIGRDSFPTQAIHLLVIMAEFLHWLLRHHGYPQGLLSPPPLPTGAWINKPSAAVVNAEPAEKRAHLRAQAGATDVIAPMVNTNVLDATRLVQIAR